MLGHLIVLHIAMLVTYTAHLLFPICMSYKILLYLYKYLHFCEIVSTPTGFSTNSRIKFCETIGWFGTSDSKQNPQERK